MRYFVIGDIHGEYARLEQQLKNWNPDNEKLVLLGDLVDRGPRSLRTIQKAIELVDEYGAIVLGGNHELMFLDWLDYPERNTDYYFQFGGIATVESFYGCDITNPYEKAKRFAQWITDGFPVEIAFLRERPNYHETDKHIFVHAGVDLVLEDWKNTNPGDFRWLRAPFINGVNQTGKRIVFGHTITKYLNEDQSHRVWFSPCGTKIGIDGGAFSGGFLHGLRINEETDELEVISV